MNWPFWKKKKEEEDNRQFEQLQEELTKEFSNIQSQLGNMGDQVKKLSRVQFKSSKNMEEKMGNFAEDLSNIHRQDDRIHHYEKQQKVVINNMIRLLDEFDHVSSGLNENDQWRLLLNGWSKTMENSLQVMGVYRLNVLGKTFNPEVAESVKTVTKDTLQTPPVVPYEVIDILNRGYVSESGQLIRKAKVITVKENEDE